MPGARTAADSLPAAETSRSPGNPLSINDSAGPSSNSVRTETINSTAARNTSAGPGRNARQTASMCSGSGAIADPALVRDDQVGTADITSAGHVDSSGRCNAAESPSSLERSR